MALDLVERLARFSKMGNRFVALYCAVPAALFGALFVWGAISKTQRLAQLPPGAYGPDPSGDWMIAGVCLVFFAIGVFAYVRGRSGKRHPVYRLLRDRAREVVQVVRVTKLGTGRDELTFLLASGVGGSLLVPTHEAAEVVVALKAALPHARFGAGPAPASDVTPPPIAVDVSVKAPPAPAFVPVAAAPADPSDVYAPLPFAVREIVREQDQSAKKTGTIGGIVVALLGVGFATWITIYAASRFGPFHMRSEELWPALGGLAVAGLGIWWMVASRNPSHVIATFARPGAQIVWMYLVDHTSNSGFRKLVSFGFSDGSSERIAVDPSRASAILQQLAHDHPRAVIGYSEENELAFRAQRQTSAAA